MTVLLVVGQRVGRHPAERRRSVASSAATIVGSVLSQTGITTRNRDQASHAQNSQRRTAGRPAARRRSPTATTAPARAPTAGTRGRCPARHAALGRRDRPPGGALRARDSPSPASSLVHHVGADPPVRALHPLLDLAPGTHRSAAAALTAHRRPPPASPRAAYQRDRVVITPGQLRPTELATSSGQIERAPSPSRRLRELVRSRALSGTPRRDKAVGRTVRRSPPCHAVVRLRATACPPPTSHSLPGAVSGSGAGCERRDVHHAATSHEVPAGASYTRNH